MIPPSRVPRSLAFVALAASLAAGRTVRADEPPRGTSPPPGVEAPSPPPSGSAPSAAAAPPTAASASAPPPAATAPPAPTEATPEPSPVSDPIDVRIDGGRAPRASRDPDVASYVARGDALRRPGETAAGAVAASPGVQIARSGAGSDLATVSIRGASSASLPVYLAGVRLNDDVTGGADLSTVPLFAIDRIEVYRGNAPADADRLGIGGALFIEPRLPRGSRAAASIGAGSFGALSFGAAASIGGDRAGALLSFSAQRAANDFSFADDRGTADPADDRRVTRENGDATTFDAWALARSQLTGGGRLVLLAGAFAREQGVTGAAEKPARSARSRTQREIAAVSARLPCASSQRTPSGAEDPPRAGTGSSSRGALPGASSPASDRPEVVTTGGEAVERCSIELTASAITSRRSISDPDRELGFLASRADIAGERWQQAVRLRVRLGERWRAGVALFTGVDRLGLDLSSGSHTRAARLGITGSLNTAWRASGRVELFALAGGECHTALGSNLDTACALGGPAGRAGLRIAGPLGIDVLLSGGSYLRVPTLGELYGLSATVLGNPDLAPERGYTGEVSLSRGGEARPLALTWHLEVTAFARMAENLIAYRRTSNSTVAPFNVAAARTLGVEALAGLQFTRNVRIEQALSVIDPRDVTPGRTLTNDRLPYQATVTSMSLVEVSADLAGLTRYLDRAALAGRFGYRSARFATTAGTYYLPEQRDLGLDASATLLGGRLTLRFGVTNALDVANQDLLGFPLPARAFHGALEGTW